MDFVVQLTLHGFPVIRKGSCPNVCMCTVAQCPCVARKFTCMLTSLVYFDAYTALALNPAALQHCHESDICNHFV